jgi:hypothetical protein
MPPLLEDMTDPDRPVTRRELREELEALFARLPTKDDLRAFATKDDLRAFVTKDDLQAFATKDDLKPFARKDDLSATRAEMNMRFSELRTHFDVVAEDFKKQFGMLYDWVHANVDNLAQRTESIENGHGGQLLRLETRVTRLENPK